MIPHRGAARGGLSSSAHARYHGRGGGQSGGGSGGRPSQASSGSNNNSSSTSVAAPVFSLTAALADTESLFGGGGGSSVASASSAYASNGGRGASSSHNRDSHGFAAVPYGHPRASPVTVVSSLSSSGSRANTAAASSNVGRFAPVVKPRPSPSNSSSFSSSHSSAYSSAAIAGASGSGGSGGNQPGQRIVSVVKSQSAPSQKQEQQEHRRPPPVPLFHPSSSSCASNASNSLPPWMQLAQQQRNSSNKSKNNSNSTSSRQQPHQNIRRQRQPPLPAPTDLIGFASALRPYLGPGAPSLILSERPSPPVFTLHNRPFVQISRGQLAAMAAIGSDGRINKVTTVPLSSGSGGSGTVITAGGSFGKAAAGKQIVAVGGGASTSTSSDPMLPVGQYIKCSPEPFIDAVLQLPLPSVVTQPCLSVLFGPAAAAAAAGVRQWQPSLDEDEGGDDGSGSGIGNDRRLSEPRGPPLPLLPRLPKPHFADYFGELTDDLAEGNGEEGDWFSNGRATAAASTGTSSTAAAVGEKRKRDTSGNAAASAAPGAFSSTNIGGNQHSNHSCAVRSIVRNWPGGLFPAYHGTFCALLLEEARGKLGQEALEAAQTVQRTGFDAAERGSWTGGSGGGAYRDGTSSSSSSSKDAVFSRVELVSVGLGASSGGGRGGRRKGRNKGYSAPPAFASGGDEDDEVDGDDGGASALLADSNSGMITLAITLKWPSCPPSMSSGNHNCGRRPWYPQLAFRDVVLLGAEPADTRQQQQQKQSPPASAAAIPPFLAMVEDVGDRDGSGSSGGGGGTGQKGGGGRGDGGSSRGGFSNGPPTIVCRANLPASVAEALMKRWTGKGSGCSGLWRLIRLESLSTIQQAYQAVASVANTPFAALALSPQLAVPWSPYAFNLRKRKTRATKDADVIELDSNSSGSSSGSDDDDDGDSSDDGACDGPGVPAAAEPAAKRSRFTVAPDVSTASAAASNSALSVLASAGPPVAAHQPPPCPPGLSRTLYDSLSARYDASQLRAIFTVVTGECLTTG